MTNGGGPAAGDGDGDGARPREVRACPAVLFRGRRSLFCPGHALTAEASSGRIHGVLDVTDPEVLPADSPLYSLPNVLLTPHIAGSLGGELQRITAGALKEVERYCDGREFAYPVTRAALAVSA